MDNKINFIHLNTAINCNGDNTLKQIVDIYSLSNLHNTLNKKIPSIILAHHSLEDIHKSHKDYLIRFITNWNASAYLCGDTHKQFYYPIMTHRDTGSNIPCIVCGKSAPEIKDNYSDLGCILYLKDTSSNEMNVIPFSWNDDKKVFLESNCFHKDSGNLHFKLLVDHTPEKNKSVKNNKLLSKKESIWLPDAEKAQGTQARFEIFAETEIINKFSDEQPSFWGISAVKGIGKTFVLQIKRRFISKNRLCLPIGVKPSTENGWGTDSIEISDYVDLNCLKEYKNSKLLWEYGIILYTINQLINIEINLQEKDVWWSASKPTKSLKDKLYEFSKSGKIDIETYKFCNNEDYNSLDSMINSVLSTKGWVNIAKKSLTSLYLIGKAIEITLKNLNKDKVAIFIDKIDQSLPQANSEPPTDCEICWKRDKVSQCKNKSYECNNKTTSCRIECCYGCEKYETPYSNTSLRVYGANSIYTHVNIWQYLQIGLMHAVNDIKSKLKGNIEVYFTIREEAYSCQLYLFGDKSKKITNIVRELWYTKEQQRQIFFDCIRNQQDYLLCNPNLKNKNEKLEEAFVGVSSLCHPYVKDLSESVFDSIYRHSFDRSRDIQEYGEYLTLHIDEIRRCQTMLEKGELVKQLIESKAAEMAFYISDEKVIDNKSYYVEKLSLLPNYWSNPENFKKLITLIPKNLLFAREIRSICKRFNNLRKCCKNCDKCEANYHPFSMLYKLGMLGKIKIHFDWKKDIEMDFLHSKQITYITGQNIENISDNNIYILHPALTKSIEHLNKKILHFNGFIIGKGLKVSSERLALIVEEQKKLKQDDFNNKYFNTKSF